MTRTVRGAAWVALACSLGCQGELRLPADTGDTGGFDPDVPCAPSGPPRLDVGEGPEGWGIDGIEIETGIPPQGGAPYARFRVRVAHVDLSDGAEVAVQLFDSEDAWIGGAEVMARFVCANVGDNADHWVTPEVHVRFDGRTLEALDGVPVRIEASVTGEDASLEHAGSGQLYVEPDTLEGL